MGQIDLRQEFVLAQTGRGSSLLSVTDAQSLLALAQQEGFYFQSLEAFVVEDDRHVPDFGKGIHGLRDIERGATSSELNTLAKEILAEAAGSDDEVIFQIWLDKG